MLFVTYLIYIDIHIQGDSKISLEKKTVIGDEVRQKNFLLTEVFKI
jgi:hypothetical protein